MASIGPISRQLTVIADEGADGQVCKYGLELTYNPTAPDTIVLALYPLQVPTDRIIWAISRHRLETGHESPNGVSDEHRTTIQLIPGLTGNELRIIRRTTEGALTIRACPADVASFIEDINDIGQADLDTNLDQALRDLFDDHSP